MTPSSPALPVFESVALNEWLWNMSLLQTCGFFAVMTWIAHIFMCARSLLEMYNPKHAVTIAMCACPGPVHRHVDQHYFPLGLAVQYCNINIRHQICAATWQMSCTCLPVVLQTNCTEHGQTNVQQAWTWPLFGPLLPGNLLLGKATSAITSKSSHTLHNQTEIAFG